MVMVVGTGVAVSGFVDLAEGSSADFLHKLVLFLWIFVFLHQDHVLV